MNEQEKVAAIREELPATLASVYLNTGTCGPLPRRSAQALRAQLERELARGRIDHEGQRQGNATKEELRRRFARLLAARPEEIALTHHTSDGMNIAIWGLNWQPGDELVITSLEHHAGVMPAHLLSWRRGVTVRVVDLGLGDGDVCSQLERAITPRTRLLCLSHVSYSSGALLPLAEIVEMAHRHHVLVLADGAQAAGAIPVDVHALDVDLYAVPGQKWLCGPEGIGALYVRQDRWTELNPTFVGYASLWPGQALDLASGQFLLAPDARRYQVATVNAPLVYAMLASLRWLEEKVGWAWAFARIAALAEQASEMLDQLPGVKVLTPSNRAGLISFAVEGWQPERVVQELAARGVLIRSIDEFRCLRVSTGFYNSGEDLTRLRDALLELLGSA